MKLLLTLLEERSITRVATKLSVSQQAVSEQLKKLRQAFDDKLFVRAKNGVVPTPFADELGTVLKTVITQLEGVGEPAVFKPELAERSYVIAASEYAQLVILSDFAQALHQHCPRMQLVIKSLCEDSIESALTQGQIDLAIGEDHQLPPILAKRKLLSDAYVCVARKRKDSTEVQRRQHLVLTRTQSHLDHMVSQWENSLDLNHYTTLSVPSYALAPTFINAYNAVALMPSRLLDNKEFEILPTRQQPPYFDIVAAWHSRATQDPLHRWLIDNLSEVCANKRHPLPQSA
ncbi:LysR family transcriptional regulator [Halioxenophilus aromaticivorans]